MDLSGVPLSGNLDDKKISVIKFLPAKRSASRLEVDETLPRGYLESEGRDKNASFAR